MRQVEGWMTDAGMRTRIDEVGNVVGRYEGLQAGARTFLIGSHIDTVVDAGKYDGSLGVLAGIVVVDALHRAGERLPSAIEAIALGDEEGVRCACGISHNPAESIRTEDADVAVRVLLDVVRNLATDA